MRHIMDSAMSDRGIAFFRFLWACYHSMATQACLDIYYPISRADIGPSALHLPFARLEAFFIFIILFINTIELYLISII